MIKRIALAIVAAVSVLASLPVRAQNLVSLSDIAQVTILPGWRTDEGTHMAAIRIALADGWKTYWRAPGEAGIPPSFDWSLSENLASVEFHWPVPTVFYTNGLRSIGYKGVTVIPIELTPKKVGGDPIELRGNMQLGVCEDVCIPMNAGLKASLTMPGSKDQAISASLARRPTNAADTGIRPAVCTVKLIDDGLRISVDLTLPKQGEDEVTVIEVADPSIWVAEPETRRKGKVLSATTDLVAPSGAPFALSRSDVRITVLAGGKALEFQGCNAG